MPTPGEKLIQDIKQQKKINTHVWLPLCPEAGVVENYHLIDEMYIRNHSLSGGMDLGHLRDGEYQTTLDTYRN